jgi:cytochrome c556
MYKALIPLAGLVALSAVAQAESPENYIDYRKAVMKAIGGHMGASTQIMRGRVSPEGALAIHADALAALNADLGRLFPDGSDFGETKAKPEIWQDREGFAKVVAQGREATAGFAAAVASGDQAQIAKAHKAVGDSCKACHQDFRLKDD